MPISNNGIKPLCDSKFIKQLYNTLFPVNLPPLTLDELISLNCDQDYKVTKVLELEASMSSSETQLEIKDEKSDQSYSSLVSSFLPTCSSSLSILSSSSSSSLNSSSSSIISQSPPSSTSSSSSVHLSFPSVSPSAHMSSSITSSIPTIISSSPKLSPTQVTKIYKFIFRNGGRPRSLKDVNIKFCTNCDKYKTKVLIKFHYSSNFQREWSSTELWNKKKWKHVTNNSIITLPKSTQVAIGEIINDEIYDSFEIAKLVRNSGISYKYFGRYCYDQLYANHYKEIFDEIDREEYYVEYKFTLPCTVCNGVLNGREFVDKKLYKKVIDNSDVKIDYIYAIDNDCKNCEDINCDLKVCYNDLTWPTTPSDFRSGPSEEVELSSGTQGVIGVTPISGLALPSDLQSGPSEEVERTTQVILRDTERISSEANLGGSKTLCGVKVYRNPINVLKKRKLDDNCKNSFLFFESFDEVSTNCTKDSNEDGDQDNTDNNRSGEDKYNMDDKFINDKYNESIMEIIINDECKS